MKYYLAYGSNLHVKQMAFRCPSAQVEGISTIEDYELVFRGRYEGAVATIQPKEGSSVPVVVWSITPADEEALDWYEGFPRLYIKQMFEVELNGDAINAMAYVMTPGRMYGKPAPSYLRTISTGYETFGLDRRPLALAAKISAARARGDSCNSPFKF
ncbi:MAG: gamma-glutamylcyclotransferase [Schwartzia sp.]|nr:gamma-glutamylcyclotransferase [Schwartzia sp. (in: firmicutes)]